MGEHQPPELVPSLLSLLKSQSQSPARGPLSPPSTAIINGNLIRTPQLKREASENFKTREERQKLFFYFQYSNIQLYSLLHFLYLSEPSDSNIYQTLSAQAQTQSRQADIGPGPGSSSSIFPKMWTTQIVIRAR